MKASAAALLLVVGLLPHAPFLAGGCITDDFMNLARVEDAPRLAAIFSGPDGGGFYRPIVHTSYLAQARISGFGCEPGYRATNLALHGLVILLACAFATRVLASPRAGLFAALIFALAPKASTITVFWISARFELLMSVFVLAAALAWTRWLRGGHAALVGVTAVCYVLALLSKEAAILLPAILLFVPNSRRPLRQQLVAGAAISSGAAVVLLMQVRANAVLVAFQPAEFALSPSPGRWARNLWNYFGRAVPVPAVMMLASGIARRRWRELNHAGQPRAAIRVVLFGAAWFAAFIAPALLLTLRSEVRLYLPGFGLAVAAGYFVHRLTAQSRAGTIAVAVVTVVLLAYQASRSLEASRDARFSRQFVAALRTVSERPVPAADSGGAEPRVRREPRAIAIVPADAATDRRLRDAIGGYGYIVIRRVLHDDGVSGIVLQMGQPVPPGARALRCTLQADGVVLSDM